LDNFIFITFQKKVMKLNPLRGMSIFLINNSYRSKKLIYKCLLLKKVYDVDKRP